MRFGEPEVNATDQLIVSPSRPPMPKWRWRVLLLGTLMALCVYYLNYGRAFNEGDNASSLLTLGVRIAASAMITGSLYPLRIRPASPWLLIALFGLFGVSFLVAFGVEGEVNDTLFLNTLIQVPALWALCQTRWRVDSAGWLRFVATCLILQSFVDLGLFVTGNTLWLSQAFVGGLGNPSSYGVTCAVALAFCLFHPRAGRFRAAKAAMLTVIAVMSMSLFTALGVMLLYSVWVTRDVRRLLVAVAVVIGTGMLISAWLASQEDENFLIHKFAAAAAVIGLVEYDADTSLTVTGRAAGYERTMTAIRKRPLGLITGHLEDKVYWPQDSQALTYLGSFGVLMLTAFVLLHALWMAYAARRWRADGGFTLLALALFGLMFFTNRILDYYPVATLYFFCIAMAFTGEWHTVRVKVSALAPLAIAAREPTT